MSNKKVAVKLLADSGQRLRYKMTWKDGSKLVLKVNIGKNPMLKNFLDREQVALEVLKGLAVPERASLKRNDIAKILSLSKNQKKFSYVAMEWVSWPHCWERNLTPDEALGVWVWALEQMCAFRRKGVLYSDIKAVHLLVSEDFTQAKIIDFDTCLMVEPEGLYPIDLLQFTPQFSAPEFCFLAEHSERILTYQMGILLGGLLVVGLDNARLNVESLEMMKSKFQKSNNTAVTKVFEACISHDPNLRPGDLEDLFAQVLKAGLSPATIRIWDQLRSPYLKKLLKLGFPEHISTQIQAA